MTTIFEELGVRPVINAQGIAPCWEEERHRPEIRALMDAAEDYYGKYERAEGRRRSTHRRYARRRCRARNVRLLQLHWRMRRGGCMTGDDVDRIERIPDTQDMPNEIIIQRQLRVKYDRCMTIPGGRLVEIGSNEQTTVEDLEAAIGSQTAAIHYLAPGDRSPRRPSTGDCHRSWPREQHPDHRRRGRTGLSDRPSEQIRKNGRRSGGLWSQVLRLCQFERSTDRNRRAGPT